MSRCEGSGTLSVCHVKNGLTLAHPVIFEERVVVLRAGAGELSVNLYRLCAGSAFRWVSSQLYADTWRTCRPTKLAPQ